jgi:hypothetical protein
MSSVTILYVYEPYGPWITYTGDSRGLDGRGLVVSVILVWCGVVWCGAGAPVGVCGLCAGGGCHRIGAAACLRGLHHGRVRRRSRGRALCMELMCNWESWIYELSRHLWSTWIGC